MSILCGAMAIMVKINDLRSLEVTVGITLNGGKVYTAPQDRQCVDEGRPWIRKWGNELVTLLA